MSLRFRLSVAVIAAAAALPAADRRAGAIQELGRAAEKLPRAQRGDRTKNLDFLFEALKIAPDAASAKHIEERIWAVWTASGSDTANLLMTRVKAATEAQNVDLALKLLDAVVEIRPDYVEAGTGAPRSTTRRRTTAARSPTCARCSCASRAISGRCPASA